MSRIAPAVGSCVPNTFITNSPVHRLQGVAAGGGNCCVGGGGTQQCNWALNRSDLCLNVGRVGLAYKF